MNESVVSRKMTIDNKTVVMTGNVENELQALKRVLSSYLDTFHDLLGIEHGNADDLYLWFLEVFEKCNEQCLELLSKGAN